MSSSTSTAGLLRAQWTNPNDVLSVLLIIGGDLVQKALAQTSGGFITPVCLSFGWVAYSLTALVGIVGDGRLLPPPDCPAKVFNLQNGYARENKNWVVGRLVRDNEIYMSQKFPLDGKGIRIAVYEAKPRRGANTNPGSGRVRIIALIVMSLQFGIAAIPWALDREWGVFLITVSGTVFAIAAGALPQWKAEKLPVKRNSTKNFALTSGNGSRDIMVILGCGESLDLEDLATSETPRSARLWEATTYLSSVVYESNGEVKRHHKSREPVRRAKTFRGIPVGYWITLGMCVVQCFWWLALLITVAGLRSHAWYLLLVGILGMFQNSTLAGISCSPTKRGLPLHPVEVICTRRVMDGLMDYDFMYRDYAQQQNSASARHLVKEFFPGELEAEEEAWWKGNTMPYDDKREKESRSSRTREPPRTKIGRLETYNLTSNSPLEINTGQHISFSQSQSLNQSSPVEMPLGYDSTAGFVPLQSASPRPFRQYTRATRPSSPLSTPLTEKLERPLSPVMPDFRSGLNSGTNSVRNSYGSGSTTNVQQSSRTRFSNSSLSGPSFARSGINERDFGAGFGSVAGSPQRRDTEATVGINEFKIAPSPDWV